MLNAAPKSQTLLTVDDVLASSRWYSTLLGLQPISSSFEDTHSNTYNRLMYGGDLVLQLHAWDEEAHPNMVDRESGPRGHGILIWFEVADFDDSIKRARILGAEIIAEPSTNPNSDEREVWLRDPDGYTVVLSNPH